MNPTTPNLAANPVPPTPQALASVSLLDVLVNAIEDSLEISKRLKLQGAPNHGCNCLDYRLGVMDGLCVAKSIVEKLQASNERAEAQPPENQKP
jgi:hypothetical protein